MARTQHPFFVDPVLPWGFFWSLGSLVLGLTPFVFYYLNGFDGLIDRCQTLMVIDINSMVIGQAENSTQG